MGQLGEKIEDSLLAIIGDVRGSRLSQDRPALQRRLETGLMVVNQECRRYLVADFVITLGDEFQGLLGAASSAMLVLAELDTVFAGIPVRYGLGWGGLTTPIRPQAVGMDGPCFHAARGALTRSKRAQRWVTIEGFGQENDTILNGILGLIGGVRTRWKPKQAETVALMRKARLQKEVAASRGVVESVVSDTLKAALYGPMLAAEQAVSELLRRFTVPTDTASPAKKGLAGSITVEHDPLKQPGRTRER